MKKLREITSVFIEVATELKYMSDNGMVSNGNIENVLIQLYNEKCKELNEVINELETKSGYILYDGRIENVEGDIIDYGEADELYDDIYKALGDNLGYLRDNYNMFDITIYDEYDVTEYWGFSSLPATFGNIRHHQGNAMFSNVDNFVMFNDVIYLLGAECEYISDIGNEL